MFIGLWTQADREGRLEDRPARLKAMIFPYDDLDVNDGLGCLAHANLITRYESDGLRLICICTWAKHQRPQVSEPESELPPLLTSTAHKSSEKKILECLEGKGKEGKGREGTLHARGLFDLFWEAYPRKIGKDAAWGMWQRLRPDVELTSQMIAKVEEQQRSAQWLKDGGQFIPHPRTWLSQGRWQDGPMAPVNASKGASTYASWRPREASE